MAACRVWVHLSAENQKFFIRPLAKLKLQFKITNTGNEVESQAKSFSSISIAFGKDSKTLDEADGMLVTHALS